MILVVIAWSFPSSPLEHPPQMPSTLVITLVSGDFDRYWEFHIEQDQRRLYRRSKVATPKINSYTGNDDRWFHLSDCVVD